MSIFIINMSSDQTNQTNQTNDDQPEKPVTEPPKIGLSNDEYARECQRLGLRENPPDPWYCFCCVFCLEACFSAAGGAPAASVYNQFERKLTKKHNWDNNSIDDADDYNINDDAFGIMLMSNVLGHNNDGHDSGHDGGYDGGDCGGDGGGCGGGDCGGGE